MPADQILAAYNKPFMPALFDILITAMFAPFGGVGRLRSQSVDLASVRPGMKVLELGCGTGSITELLLQRGSEVTAIDGSHRMLEKASRRARGAVFIRQELESLEISGQFDVVFFGFVLHELDRPLRREVLKKAVGALAAQGRIVVLDHAVPAKGIIARAWRRFLMRLEPPSVVECIEDGYARDLNSVGLEIDENHSLAHGTAMVTVSVMRGMAPKSKRDMPVDRASP